MQKRGLMVLAAVAGILSAWSLPAYGDFTKLVSNFDGTYTFLVDTPECNVIFRAPRTASTTSAFIHATAGNATWVTTFYKNFSDGQSLNTYWQWQDRTQHIAWVRFQSFNTVDIPNPSLHLGGKVKFKIAGQAYTDSTYMTEVPGARLFLGAGIRESGVSVPQGANGGTSGAIEWVDVDKLIEILPGANLQCQTTALITSDDVQVTPVSTNGVPADTVCVSAGLDHILQTTKAGDDAVTVTPKGNIAVPLNGLDPTDPWQSVEFDLAALQTALKVSNFSPGTEGTSGFLDVALKIRGTLEHLTLTNDPATNGPINANAIMLCIEDVEFVSPIPDPPVIQSSPALQPLDTSVTVNGIDLTATSVELYIQGRGLNPNFLLGSVANPGAASVTFSTTVAPLLAVPLPPGVNIFARQQVATLWSDNSTPVRIFPPGNSPVRLSMAIRETDQYDHALNCGDNGTGFNADLPSTLEFFASTGNASGAYGCPDNGKRITPQFGWQDIVINPCPNADGMGVFSGNGVVNLRAAPDFTNGVWEGLYFRIDNLSPGAGPYTVYIDDMEVIDVQANTQICLVDDFEQPRYTIGQHIVEGTVAGGPPATGLADSVATGDDVQVIPFGNQTTAGQIIVSPGLNGTLETTPAVGEYASSIRGRFNTPGSAGTSMNVAASPQLSAVTAEQANSGTQSLKLQWAFTEAGVSVNTTHLRLTSDNFLQNAPVTTYTTPDSVIPLSQDGTWCDGTGDIAYRFKLKIEPNPIMGDCNDDGDVDAGDFGCLQGCWGATGGTGLCDDKFDYYTNNTVDAEDLLIFTLSMSGPT